ncbi:hypothetical protein ACKU2E_027330 [Klebsiella pneumoniae]
MFWRTWRGEKLWKMEQEEEHSHGHHDHDETRIIDTGHKVLELDFRRSDNPSLAFTLAQRQEMGSSRYFLVTKSWSVGIIFTGI